MQYLKYFIGLIITITIELILYSYIDKKSDKNSSISNAFKSTVRCMILWCFGLIIQILILNFTSINPLYIDYFIYIPVVFCPVTLFIVAKQFSNENYRFSKKYLILLFIPVITVLILWTNNFHHLFYKVYSINPANTIFGPYFYIYSIFIYGLYVIDIVILLKNSIYKFGALSMQSFLIAVGAAIPVVLNILGMTIFKINIYVTPISFSISILLISIAILKYNFLDLNPIALQRIVDQISDSYLVINKYEEISDCNKAFENIFKVKKEKIIKKNFKSLKLNNMLSIENTNINSYIKKAQKNDKTYKINAKFNNSPIYFNIEISGIFSNNECIGVLILFKDVTQHIIDMQNLKENQSILMERERLATLGQMIGGIAHNLKTPIMSIAGAMEGLKDLITEYDKSIDDPDVTSEDHHSIAKEMNEWIEKVNSYDSYMSDIITAVKGQAVNFTNDTIEKFTIDELLTRVNILMRHELKNAIITLNTDCQINKQSKITGNVNSLVQVVNNLISNAIQSYDLNNITSNRKIDLTIFEKNNNIFITVKDYGCGIPEDVQKKLFNEMITTKGHNGTGLGLFMSYSTIKGNFKGDLSFTSKVGEGTTFTIELPQ